MLSRRYILILAAAAGVSLLGAVQAAAAQDTGAGGSGGIPDGFIPVAPPGPVGIVSELYEAHSDITGLMAETARAVASEEYVHEEVYLEAVWVDEEAEKLVLWLNPVQLVDPIDEEDLREELELDVPLDIRYGYFVPEASPSQADPCPGDSDSALCDWWGYYVDRCLPEHTISRCTTYTTLIRQYGYEPPSMLPAAADTDGDGINDDVDECDTQAENVNGYRDADGCPDTPPAPASGTAVFRDDFSGGLSRWTESGQLEWQAGTLDDGVAIQGYGTDNMVAEADDCDDEACVLSMRHALDLSGYSSATLEFDRYVDRNLDRNEYLAVEVGNGSPYTEVLRWTHGDGDDSRWHSESVSLGSYLAAGFNVRFVTEQSSSSEDVGIDNVLISGEVASDVCVLDVSASLSGTSITASWDACDGVRHYQMWLHTGSGWEYLGWTPSGTSVTEDGLDEGGTYYVAVRAQYDDGTHTDWFYSRYVTVPVTDTVPPVVTVPGDMTVDSSASTAVTFAASAYDAADGTRPVTCIPASGAVFPMGQTTVSCRATDSSGNVGRASFTVTVRPAPPPGEEAGSTPGGGSGRPSGDAAEYYGGSAYGMEFHDINDGPLLRVGTVTIGANNSHGTAGLVTAEHTIRLAEGQSFVRHCMLLGANLSDPHQPCTEFTSGIASEVVNNSTDAAFIPITHANVVVGSKVKASDGTIFDVTHGSLNDVARYSIISIYGALNNGDGRLLFKNATLHGDVYELIENAGISTYPSEDGDSGSPIISRSTGQPKLVGVHAGKICEFEDASAGQGLVNVSRFESLCSDESSYYKAFSAWENVRSALGLR